MEEAWPLTPLGTGPSGAGLPQGHNDGSGGTIVRRDFTGVGQKKTWQEEGR